MAKFLSMLPLPNCISKKRKNETRKMPTLCAGCTKNARTCKAAIMSKSKIFLAFKASANIRKPIGRAKKCFMLSRSCICIKLSTIAAEPNAVM